MDTKTTQVKTAKVLGTPAYEQPTEFTKSVEMPVYVINELLRTYKATMISVDWKTQKTRLGYQVTEIDSQEGLDLFKEKLMAEAYIQQTLYELDK